MNRNILPTMMGMLAGTGFFDYMNGIPKGNGLACPECHTHIIEEGEDGDYVYYRCQRQDCNMKFGRPRSGIGGIKIIEPSKFAVEREAKKQARKERKALAKQKRGI